MADTFAEGVGVVAVDSGPVGEEPSPHDLRTKISKASAIMKATAMIGFLVVIEG